MRKLIFIIGLSLSFQAMAQNPAIEAGWKSKLRSAISSLAGEGWSNKLLGPIPVQEPEIKLPGIPANLKRSTDIESYTRLKKDPTEYDRLPTARKRQFDYKFLEELFRVTRKSEPKDEDLSNWLNTLDQGGSREGIYQALTLDEVYSALENMDEKPSTRLVDFSLKFSQRFLNQTFKKESLSSLNLYSLKRILTEKGLDLLEYYEVHNLEDLHLWYAVFSSELASEYGPLLKSQVREEAHLNYHLEWARSMPIQHIKSEFIIKLHSVMNGLQLLE